MEKSMEIITVIAVVATVASIWWSVGNAQTSREKLQAALSQIDELKTKPTGKAKNKKNDTADNSALKGELSNLKRELNQAKKKAHDTQSELKAELDRERASRKELEKRLNDTPAFQDESAKAKAEPAPTKVAAPKEEAKPESKEQAPVAAPVVDEESELGKVEALVAKLKEERSELIESKKKLKRELKDARYRVERYRRIDLVKQREHELVDDRLLTMGRLYYDAVSAIAAMKGEVVPPKPRELREAEARAAERAARDAKAEEVKAKLSEEDESAASLGSALQAEEDAQLASRSEEQAETSEAEVSADVAAEAVSASAELQANPA